VAEGSQEICCCGIPQLCDSRGGRPVPNSPCGLCGRKATLNTLQSSGAVWGKKVSNLFFLPPVNYLRAIFCAFWCIQTEFWGTRLVKVHVHVFRTDIQTYFKTNSAVYWRGVGGGVHGSPIYPWDYFTFRKTLCVAWRKGQLLC